VSIIPLGFHGESVVARVVGGGRVGTRRALALLEAGPPGGGDESRAQTGRRAGGAKIIAAEVEKYWEWLAGLAAVPVAADVRSRMERLRADELAMALRRINGLSSEQAEGVEMFSRALMNKFLHEPSVRLRAAAANGRGLVVVDAARYLFALEPGEKPPAPDAAGKDK
jgi:hypothetical protein